MRGGRIAALAALTLAASAQAAPRRSLGYAGSTPVGLDAYGAFAELDCDRINKEPRRSHVRVPLSGQCAVVIPAPDGKHVIRAQPGADEQIDISVNGRRVVRALEQPAVLLWRPDSRGFLINDGEGSGQTSRLRYFAFRNGRWHESRAFDRAASSLYLKRYDCRGGDASYVNVSGWEWFRGGRLRAIVQEGVHSEGCIQPYQDRNVLLEVIGDPLSGRIARAREVRKLR